MNDKIQLKEVMPKEIEKMSMSIIESEMTRTDIDPYEKAVIKRAIHTSADFDYLDNLVFSNDAVKKGIEAIKKGVTIVTDTNMAKAGINKKTLESFGGTVQCFIADEDVAKDAQENGTTRAVASMKKAMSIEGPMIFAIGNAPTALVKIYELIKEDKLKPELIVAAPVGFVNVVESKELILDTDENYIVARGRKGGSNVAAAIINAMLYMARDWK